jgi:hypothetical protein
MNLVKILILEIRTFKIKYGTNLGDEVTFMTYVVSAGTDIVAYEKFSGEYTLLNSYQPLLTAGVVLRGQDSGVHFLPVLPDCVNL